MSLWFLGLMGGRARAKWVAGHCRSVEVVTCVGRGGTPSEACRVEGGQRALVRRESCFPLGSSLGGGRKGGERRKK